MRRNAIFCALISMFLLVGNMSNAQTIIRQSVGTLGGSIVSGNTYMAAAIGQSYDVSTSSTDFQFTPGFIQPQRAMLSEQALQLQLNVFPNPASNLVQIELDLVATNLSLAVMDIHGKIIHEQDYSVDSSINIDCSIWATGTYFVTVSCDEYKPQTSKLIINH